ncbi:coproporphyrinogen III oxidase [Nostocoides sp. F2B08]|uniref:radical SAM family heme chaperone HemW n=1 Tax=Nostocoides sp. F2B08 TaxID=2653936 RepID=UPI0012635B88|nr:radical SAM family heme chaperone HemW [Tetrasphaera sp. F2B08]KAB7744756.1 coproporphyrinogen III oxidase [Tetrasphaera sp. F2B08]
MPQLPDGEPVPTDGSLPATALDAMAANPFSAYLHVPFCRVRCGYCDFNTYTPGELGDAASVPNYVRAVEREIALAREVLTRGGRAMPPLTTVFVGGGTPTMLAAPMLAGLVGRLLEAFGTPGEHGRPIEITTEANPDSVTPEGLEILAQAGVSRISIGMQSAVPHVLATLDRTHDPTAVGRAVRWAKDAGLQVSLDLIYGTPGESLADWEHSLRTALEQEPDHVSAYALIVEDGTRLATQVRRGELPAPDPDDAADSYELADALLRASGLRWYEVSNWARSDTARCRHNLGYWTGGSWWGFGPGAHSHVGGVRWWNVKHPRAYADRLASGTTPAAAREILTPDEVYDETVLLGVRLADGLPIDALRPEGRGAVAALIADGLVQHEAALRDRRLVLSMRGRLLADAVVRRLVLGL